MKKKPPKTFRPTEKSSEIIEEIQEVFGWNFQQIINEIIENEGQDFLNFIFSQKYPVFTGLLYGGSPAGSPVRSTQTLR